VTPLPSTVGRHILTLYDDALQLVDGYNDLCASSPSSPLPLTWRDESKPLILTDIKSYYDEPFSRHYQTCSQQMSLHVSVAPDSLHKFTPRILAVDRSQSYDKNEPRMYLYDIIPVPDEAYNNDTNILSLHGICGILANDIQKMAMMMNACSNTSISMMTYQRRIAMGATGIRKHQHHSLLVNMLRTSDCICDAREPSLLPCITSIYLAPVALQLPTILILLMTE
jgi:hypothetical protein